MRKDGSHDLRIAGGKQDGLYSAKVWRILTTMLGLAKAFPKPCKGDHRHAKIEGSVTQQSGHYPQPMADVVHDEFRKCQALELQEPVGIEEAIAQVSSPEPTAA